VTDQAPPAEVAGGRLNGAGAQRAGGPAGSASPRALPYRQPFTWWLRRRGYVLYMIRELSSLPIAIWWVLFLVEVARLRSGTSGYRPLEPWFVVVSVICLVAALWHTVTFLSLAGLIMRIPLGDRHVPGKVIVRAAFGGFVVVTAVIAGLLIWGGA
jgi:fumarate reductase subunit C